jgi:carbonic anhydrase/acetyltransferase-like protein (isoleucine patch superfamily)
MTTQSSTNVNTTTTMPIICRDAEIIMRNNGNVSFGNGCIVHPKASIIAEDGCNLIFGEYNIIEEHVKIKACPKVNSNNVLTPTTIYIGNYNHFKVGCILENTHVENFNIIDMRSEANDCMIESKVIITPLVKLPKRSSIKSSSIVLENKLIIYNNNFKEVEFKKYILDLYQLLSQILPQSHSLHSISV